MQRKLFLGAVFKNEGMIIREWIQHYISQGVDHFYLINDNSTDNFQAEIQPYMDRITLYNNEHTDLYLRRQYDIYNWYFGHLRATANWLMIVDLDEFVYRPNGGTIKESLEMYDAYNQITFPSLFFGSDGHIKQPNSVRLSFTKREAVQRSYKSIVKTEAIEVLAVHKHYVIKNDEQLHLTLDKNGHSELICNHYHSQSRERWEKICIPRGDGIAMLENDSKSSWKSFEKHDFNTVEDLRLYNQIASDVTLYISTCNRPDLLKRTMESFIKYNTYPIKRCIITEDSGKTGIDDFVHGMCPFPVDIIYNEANIGLMASIEKGYALIDTKYIFHCEEDWEFYKPGFIEDSMKVIEKDKKALLVILRAHNDTNRIPIEKDLGGYHYLDNTNYPWYGYSTNPGLRRLVDYTKVAPWHETTAKPWYDKQPRMYEPDVCILYHKHGYRAAILGDKEGYVRHIGWDRHIKLPHES